MQTMVSFMMDALPFKEFLMLSDHGELNILDAVLKDMTEIDLKKCGKRLLSILTECYQINLKAFSKMLVAVILNTDSNES